MSENKPTIDGEDARKIELTASQAERLYDLAETSLIMLYGQALRVGGEAFGKAYKDELRAFKTILKPEKGNG